MSGLTWLNELILSISVAEFVILLLAAVVVGLTGFGFNVFAVPALTVVMPAKEAIVLALIAGTVVNTVMAISARGEQQLRLVARVVVLSVPGMFLGTWLHTRLPDNVVQVVVGIAIVGSAATVARRFTRGLREQDWGFTALIATSSGALTTLTGTGGPPVVAYLARVIDSHASVRASLASYSAVASAIGVGLLASAGAIDVAAIARGVGLAVPAVLGLLIGSFIFARRQAQYTVFAVTLLMLMGVSTVAAAVWPTS